MKMLATDNEFLSQSLLNSIGELMLASAQEIPEIVVVANEQLGPLLQDEITDKSLGASPSNAHQVRNWLILVLLYLTDQPEGSPDRLGSQTQQLALPFQIDRTATS